MKRVILFALLACTGCAVHEPLFQTYRLVKQETGQLLIPPGVATPGVIQRTFTADAAADRGACPRAGGVVDIQPRKKGLRVTVRRDRLVQQPPGWLSDWSAELESQGCLAPGGGRKLAAQIAESLPLDPNTAFRLLYSSQTDVAAPVRIQVVSPILTEGAASDAPIQETVSTPGGDSLTVTVKSAANLIGYETAWYAAQPKTNAIGFTIAPLYAERHIQDESERRPRPATNYFNFPAGAAFFRLFHKAGQTEFTQYVIAASTRAGLERGAKAIEAGAASCRELDGELCVAIPKAVAVNLFLPVSVNGREILVGWGARVTDAIRAAGELPNRVLPQLAVYKPYNGRLAPVEFDHANPAILGLILTGGETLSWR